jgi:MerR family transcriptional regulator, light-induced transcriptional regulator
LSESAAVASMTLHEAADELGLHYMTVYRYVRTGRLAGHRVGAEWRVAPTDVAELASARSGPGAPETRGPAPGAGAGRPGRVDHVARLVAPLLVGDEPGAWTVVQAALGGGLDPDELYLGVLGPAMREIGDRWSAGTVSVAQEHLASAVLLRVCGRLGPLFNRPGRTRGSVVVGAPAGDHHALPSVLFGDLLRGRQLAVVQLGADTPVSSFVEAAVGADRLLGVAIGVTMTGADQAVADTATALHDAGVAPVVVGGRAVRSVGAASALGADRWAGDTGSGLELFTELATEAGRRRRRAVAS